MYPCQKAITALLSNYLATISNTYFQPLQRNITKHLTRIGNVLLLFNIPELRRSWINFSADRSRGDKIASLNWFYSSIICERDFPDSRTTCVFTRYFFNSIKLCILRNTALEELRTKLFPRNCYWISCENVVIL